MISKFDLIRMSWLRENRTQSIIPFGQNHWTFEQFWLIIMFVILSNIAEVETQCTCTNGLMTFTDSNGANWDHCLQTCSAGCKQYYYPVFIPNLFSWVRQCQLCPDPSCSSCQNGYRWFSSDCYTCDFHWPGCISCNSSDCLVCESSYSLDTTQNPNRCYRCSLIDPQCTSCDSSRKCLACSPGFVRDLSKPNYNCVRTPTISNCLIVSDGPSCSACITNYILMDPTSCKTCIEAFGAQCLTCDSSTCLTCQTGYAVSGTSCATCSSLITNCTDCQDSFTCISCQTGYANLGTSCTACQSLIPQCTDCQDSSTCLSCQAGYANFGSSCTACQSLISKCTVCKDFTNFCLTCQPGYVASETGLCRWNNCGNGAFEEAEEQCDDNNTDSLDGCDSNCKIELGYQCLFANNDSSMPQLCYYNQKIKFHLTGGFKKLKRRNTFQFQLTFDTLNTFIFRELNWTNIILIDVEYFSFSHMLISDVMQPQNNTVLLNFTVDYKPTIKSFIEIQIDPKRNYQPLTVSQSKSSIELTQNYTRILSPIGTWNKFDLTSSIKETLPLKSENSLVIIYESDTVLAITPFLQYCFYAIASISLLLMVLSLTIYGGKIVALEFIFVVNCAYFSLIGFQNEEIFSILQAVNGLKIIFLNFNSISDGYMSTLWWAGFENSLIINCLGALGLMGLPIFYAIALTVLSKMIKNPESEKKLEFLKKYYGSAQVCLTFYLIGAYGFTTNFLLSLSQTVKGTNPDIFGTVIGVIIFLAGIVLFVLVIKRMKFLWEFKDHFYQDSARKYYINFTILTIWINCITLVILRDFLFANAIPIILSLVWIGCLIKFTPFKRNVERKRPIIVQAVNILVQGTFLTLKILLGTNSQLSQIYQTVLYLPFLVAFFLVVGLAHTIYCFFIKIKSAIIDRKQFLENEKLYAKGQIKIKPIETENIQQKQENEIQTIIHSIDKDIMESFRKDKSFNFMERTLDFSKDELQKQWNEFQNVERDKSQTTTDKAKQLRKIIRRSTFLDNKQIQPYFKFNFDQELNKTTEQPKRKARKMSKKKDTLGEVQKVGKLEKRLKEDATKSYVIYKHEEEKYNEEWKQFFKPKELMEEEKKHSLAIYDMI